MSNSLTHLISGGIQSAIIIVGRNRSRALCRCGRDSHALRSAFITRRVGQVSQKKL